MVGAGVYSDYIFRGISQSNRRPSVNAYIEPRYTINNNLQLFAGLGGWAAAWIFDLSNMLYGTMFMLCGAYALAQDAHVRGDFLYGGMRPRTQAAFDLALYVLFFMPGIAALIYAGYDYAAQSWHIGEHSTVTAEGHFKSAIPLAGALVMLQGLAEMARCVICLRTGEWPSRLKDAAEIDVVEEQLARSEYVDDETRRIAIARAHEIEETARQRGMGGDLNT